MSWAMFQSVCTLPISYGDVISLLHLHCRFRYTDGRWYYGVVSSLEQEGYNVNFSYPTR